MKQVPRVKICCVASIEEAQTSIRHGASAIGLVSAMPSGPGVISEQEIVRIASAVPPGVSSFLLTSATDPDAIIAQQRRCRVNAIQICDRLRVGTHQLLRDALPGIALVQVVHVVGPQSVEEAEEVAPVVDALLLDSGRPDENIRVLGGTGRVHDWRISRMICERTRVPVFLAGGLRADNVAEAITVVRPYGLDVCTGVRTDGALDETKLAAFMKAVHTAASELSDRRE